MPYSVIRTDLMSGTKQPADLVSIRFCTVDTSGDTPVYTAAAVENGVIAKLVGYEDGQREVIRAIAASDDSDLNECVIVAGVEVMYDERKKNLDEYINEAGKITRGYIPRSRNLFSVTKEAFVSATPPTVIGTKLGIGADGKISTSVASQKTELGELVAIENVGRYTYYTIRISKTEA